MDLYDCFAGHTQTDSTSHPISQNVIVGLTLSSMDWWIRKTLRHDILYSKARVICNEAVKDIEPRLSLLCRNVGGTWEDVEDCWSLDHCKDSVRLMYMRISCERRDIIPQLALFRCLGPTQCCLLMTFLA